MPRTKTYSLEPDPDYGPAPRALRYADAAGAAEQIIVDALPGIARKLVAMADDGNIAAARYLMDRIYGRPAKLSAPALADRELAFTPRDWAVAKFNEEKKREAFRRPAATAAMRGALLTSVIAFFLQHSPLRLILSHCIYIQQRNQ